MEHKAQTSKILGRFADGSMMVERSSSAASEIGGKEGSVNTGVCKLCLSFTFAAKNRKVGVFYLILFQEF